MSCIVDNWLKNYSWKSILSNLVILLVFGYFLGFNKFSMFLLGFHWAIITIKSILYIGEKNGESL